MPCGKYRSALAMLFAEVSQVERDCTYDEYEFMEH